MFLASDQLTELSEINYSGAAKAKKGSSDLFPMIDKEVTAKFKCNIVHQGVSKAQNVLLNPEWISFNGSNFVYLPDLGNKVVTFYNNCY